MREVRSGDALLRSAAYSVMRWRDGFAGWRVHRRRFRELVTYDEAQLARVVSVQLTQLLKHAFETVPYYREAWSAIGFEPASHITLTELRRLPLLTKDHIKSRKADLVSRRYASSALDVDYTGGTTGTQTSFYRNHACSIAKLGRQWGVLERCGYQPGDRRGLVWGAHRDLHPDGFRSLKRRIRDFADGQEVLCCTTMNRAEMEQYYRRLLRFRPKVLYGYPNALHELARFTVENGLQPPRVERVICTAEMLTEGQRRLFAEVFGGEVFNLYCSREHGCIGFECGRHNGFHLDVGSVVVEIIREARPARPGERGEIVITDLLNYGMPFVRYATGDLATVSESACACGLALPRIHSLDGRVADTLLRPDGRTVAGLMLADLFCALPQVRAAQFVQDTPGTVEVRVIVEGEMTSQLRSHLVDEVRSIMGDEIVIDVHVVPDIPRNPNSGKYQEVVCRLGGQTGQPDVQQGHAG